MSRARVVLFALLLTLLATGPVAAQVAMPTAAGAGTRSSAPAAAVPSADSSTDAAVVTPPAGERGRLQVAGPTETFRIRLFPGGNARWTVTANFTLSSESDEAAFEDLAADFEAGRTESDLGLDAFRRASQLASSSTGREMGITRVQRTHEVYNDTGQLVLRFTWTNFSRRSGDRLYVDDVFNTTGRTWFPDLGADQALVIVPPQNYQIVDAAPQGYAVTRGALRWEGYQHFEDGELSATYRRVGQTSTASPSRNGTGRQPGGNGALLAALAVVGIGAVAVVAYVLSTRDDGFPTPADGSDDDDGGAAGPGANAEAVEESEAATSEVDEELLSDEERIERLLEANGGRMKQANIVKETDWSNAKVSQLLSSMDDEGRIDKLRIGRENLISFPDEDVTDVDTEES